MLSVGVIGIGNCGNQIARLAKEECDCQVYAINTSENDLATLPDTIPTKLVGDSQGTGKNRDEAKRFLKKSIMEIIADDEFSNFINNNEVIIVASSTGGGSGSGMSPIFADVIRQSFTDEDGNEKIVILVGVLPRISEGFTTQVNSLAYTKEVFEKMDDPTYMLYDNNNFSRESSFNILTKVNKEIIEDIKVIQCRYNTSTVFDSIDEKDMKMILNTPGRIVISSLLNIKEKDLDATTIEQMLVDSIKNSAHAEIQRDGVISRTGLITNLNAKLNETFDTHIEEVRKFVGEPTEEFLHIAVNTEKVLPNTVNLILSGLTQISDRVDKIIERIDDINARQQAASKERRSSLLDDDELADMNARRKDRQKKEDDKVNISAIFDKFN